MSNKQMFHKDVNNVNFMDTFRYKFAQGMVYGREIALLCGGLILAAGIFFAYRWYVVQRNHRAQVAFSTLMIDIQEAMRNKDADLSNLIDKIRVQRAEHEGSAYAPYMHMAEIDLHLYQGHYAPAMRGLQAALQEFSGTPVFYLCRTKFALVSLDRIHQIGTDANEQEEGDPEIRKSLQEQLVKELTEVAYDQKNHYRDYALYYLGRYYFATGNMAEAKRVWQDLIDSQRIEKMHQSPWAVLAQSKIEQIV